MFLLCIQNQGHHDFIKIAITYMNYNEIAYTGKLCEIGDTSKSGLIMEHIINSAGVQRISINLNLADIWFFAYDITATRTPKND